MKLYLFKPPIAGACVYDDTERTEEKEDGKEGVLTEKGYAPIFCIEFEYVVKYENSIYCETVLSGDLTENRPPKSVPREYGMNIAMIQELAEFFKTLSEPVRLLLLLSLRRRELTVGELTSLTGTTTANVSKHLAIMRKAGLLERRKTGTLVYYSLRNETVFGICDCICSDIRSRYEDKRSLIAVDQGVDTSGVLTG